MSKLSGKVAVVTGASKGIGVMQGNPTLQLTDYGQAPVDSSGNSYGGSGYWPGADPSEGVHDAAVETMAQTKVDALVLTTDPTFGLIYTSQIIALTKRYRMPSVHPTREEAHEGALMSYGANFNEAVHQAAVYAGRILDGEKPADLPVLQPTTFELIINLKTARALGLTVPPSLLAVADEVIE